MTYNIRDIKIQVPREVAFILQTIRQAGHEAYIVGGCVRDCILGRVPKDWDITTSALPLQVKSLFSVTIDTGIQHGTVMVIKNGSGYEVTTYRIDGEYKDGRHPESVEFTPSLEEDLKRRDFTVNAFAYSPENGVVDLFGGMEDLNNGLIRAVGDPRKRFTEDALRIMRAVRFSAQLSFDIEENTLNAISEFGPKLALVSAERIRVEFEKTLFSPEPEKVGLYKELGLSEYVIPEYSEKCFDKKAEDLYIKMSTDLEEADTDIRYINLALFFENLSPEECSSVMRKMTFDNLTRETVREILKYKNDSLPSERAKIKHILKVTGPELFRLIIRHHSICGADIRNTEEELEDILKSGEAYNNSMLAVTGRDLIEAGIRPGPALGAELSKLLDAVIENPELNNKEALIKLL